MKRLRLAIIILLALSLTGCVQKYNLTDEQSDTVAEYMAGTLLQSDKNYTPDLIPISNTNDAESSSSNEMTTPTPTEAAGDNTTNTGTVGSSVTADNQITGYTLSEVIGDKNFDIQYVGYKITDSYPEDKKSSYFSLSPSPGNQLLVVSFAAKNISDKDVTLNLSKTDIHYQLDINAGTVYKPLLTLLENDLQYINVAVEKGKEETMLLIFEISKNTDISQINLKVSNKDKSNIIEIK